MKNRHCDAGFFFCDGRDRTVGTLCPRGCVIGVGDDRIDDDASSRRI